MPEPSFINKAVQVIRETEGKRKKLAEMLFPLKKEDLPALSGVLEERLCFKVKKHELNETIAGVDSGFVGKNLFALDLFLVRPASVIFHYRKGNLVSANYHPSFFSFPTPFLSTSVTREEDFSCSKSLHRLREEVSLARKVIETFSPQYLFIDGSIVPQHADKPRKGSSIRDFYHEIIGEFQELYSTAEKNSCELVACVEDSRGLRFKDILQGILRHFNGSTPVELNNSYDAVLLDYLLEQGERSFAFSYASSVKEHPVLNDFKKGWAERIHAFYLKPSAFDRPLRVEFLHSSNSITKHAGDLASLVYALSSLHREYAYPSVLIEADLRARLKPEEIEIVFDKISDRLGARFNLLMRRDKRPF